ncbi:MAG: hypothetical protein K0S86_5754 [Geminicoccaceae bacterium]|jgi:uncharacterized protein (DUF58 family)|nr:hypothetical protein [Geminicoccaceae bacterium]
METSRAPVRADLFDPASLASLGHVEIIARWVVDGFLTGLHRSPKKGFSVEFAEYRGYQPGDDLRFIDWKIAARANKWVVKQFEEETNLRATIILDVSRSMAWSGATTRLTKLRYAEQLVAALSLLLIRQRDAVGFIRYDDRLRSVIPPKARTAQWRRILHALEEEGSGKASIAPAALMHAARLVRKPGMVVLISDLLVESADVTEAVRVLRAVGHDVTVLHIMDPAERDLSLAGEAVFADPESGVEVPATVADVRSAYRHTVEEAIAEWRQSFSSTGAGYEVFTTDVPFGVPLRKAFAARQRLP